MPVRRVRVDESVILPPGQYEVVHQCDLQHSKMQLPVGTDWARALHACDGWVAIGSYLGGWHAVGRLGVVHRTADAWAVFESDAPVMVHSTVARGTWIEYGEGERLEIEPVDGDSVGVRLGLWSKSSGSGSSGGEKSI